MDRLQELLEQFNRLAELTDEELTQLRADVVALFDELEASEIGSDEFAAMAQISDELLPGIDAAVTERETAAAEVQAEIDRMRAAVHGETEPEGDGDPPPEGETEPEGAEEAPATETPTPGDNPDVTTEPQGTEDREPVAASTRPRIGRVAARRPARHAPRPAAAETQAVIVAGAGMRGVQPGTELTRDEFAEQFVRMAGIARQMPLSQASRLHLATVRADYPEERRLSKDNAALTEQRLRADDNAIVASGGLCAPLQPLYDVINISTDDRPVKAGLSSFQADRGGARWVPPPRLGDYDSGVDVWTVANDETPADPTTKPCVRVDCDSEQTVQVEAITRCLEVGNFFARTYDERVQAILDLLGATHARFAESRHLTKIGTGSTDVALGQHLGASRDVLAGLDLLVAGYRNRWRTARRMPLRLMLPEWGRDILRADRVRELPGSTDEVFAVADAQIDGWFAARNVNVTWFLDGEDGQIFGPQGDGTPTPWPGVTGGDVTEMVGYLFHEGAWTFLDGGTLDLGMVRDSTLNSTNDLQIFAETFENVFFRGIESLRPVFDICPNGWTSGTVDINPCTVGS